MALALTRLLKELPFKAGSAPTLIPTDVAGRHGVSVADFDARRVSPGVVAACAELRGLARDELAEAERRLKSSSPAILPAFIPLAPLRLDLDRLDRNADAPVRGRERSVAAAPAMGDLALGASAVRAFSRGATLTAAATR